MRCNGSNWAVYSPGSWDGFRNDLWALWAGVIMRLEHHLVGGYVRYISPHIIIIIIYIGSYGKKKKMVLMKENDTIGINPVHMTSQTERSDTMFVSRRFNFDLGWEKGGDRDLPIRGGRLKPPPWPPLPRTRPQKRSRDGLETETRSQDLQHCCITYTAWGCNTS